MNEYRKYNEIIVVFTTLVYNCDHNSIKSKEIERFRVGSSNKTSGKLANSLKLQEIQIVHQYQKHTDDNFRYTHSYTS